jgi:hypothetical protein
MDLPFDQKWLVQLNGNIVLTLNFKVQRKMTKLVIKMAKSTNHITLGGENPTIILEHVTIHKT